MKGYKRTKRRTKRRTNRRTRKHKGGCGSVCIAP